MSSDHTIYCKAYCASEGWYVRQPSSDRWWRVAGKDAMFRRVKLICLSGVGTCYVSYASFLVASRHHPEGQS